MGDEIRPFLLSLHVALLTTGILLFIGLPLSRWIAGVSRAKGAHAPLLRILVNAPLALPPSVLGFYFLLAFTPGGHVGSFLESVTGIRLLFTFEGLIAGSVLFSIPFMVNPLLAGFEALPASLSEAAWVLGMSRLKTFLTVILPNMAPSILAGTAMTFVHTMGEFGVVLMIGGAVPGQTLTASIAVYQAVESMRYGEAHRLALLLALVSFSALGLFLLACRRARAV